MGYKLLGIVVWKVGKSFLRPKHRSLLPPKSLLAGGVVLAIAGALLAARRLSGGD
jgi:hypothetical protein